MRTARCDECGRIVSLIAHRYAFRRHMIRKDVICEGSWDAPDVVSDRVAARLALEQTPEKQQEATHAN